MGLDGLSAEERLIPIREKTKRAKKHLTELVALGEEYRDSYTQVARMGSDKKFFTMRDPDILRLPIIHFQVLAVAGDILQNLRSALDHVVYNLALVANLNATEATLRRVAFPIGESVQEYESLKCRKVKSVILPEAIQFIDALKPYKGGNDALWLLHEANNIDKHRRLIGVGEDILCDGEGFGGYYWLKDKNPPFSSLHISEGQEQTNTPTAQTPTNILKSGALIPSLVYMVEYIDSLIENGFRPFLAPVQ